MSTIKTRRPSSTKPASEEFTWPSEDVKTLIKKIRKLIPPNDMMSYRKRLKTVPWDEIAFGEYDGNECQEMVTAMLKRLRCHRLLDEVLKDGLEWADTPWINRNRVKNMIHPDFPKRPLSTYFLFNLDHIYLKKDYPNMAEYRKKITEDYAKLSEKELSQYKERYKKNKQEYDRKMEKFLVEHPDIAKQLQKTKIKKRDKSVNPFDVFLKDRLKSTQKEDSQPDSELIPSIQKEWDDLSESEKLPWEIKSEEINKKKQMPKKEVKLSIYNFYCKKCMNTDKFKKIPGKDRFSQIAASYKSMSESERKKLQKEYDEHMQEKYPDAELETSNKKKKADQKKVVKKKNEKTEIKKGSDDVDTKKPTKKKSNKLLIETIEPKNEDTPKTSPGTSKKKKRKLENEQTDENLSRKKKKKDENEEVVSNSYPEEPVPPPDTPFALFVLKKNKKNKYTEEEMLEKWNNLEKLKKRKYKEILKARKKEFAEFEAYLNSLPKKKLKKIKKQLAANN